LTEEALHQKEEKTVYVGKVADNQTQKEKKKRT